MNDSGWKKAAAAAFPKTLPVLAGYVVLGFGFGLLQSKGYHFLWAVLMSLTIYAGSMQYVTVDLLANGAGLVSAALMTLMINARHLFYGVSMLIRYRDVGKAKPYLVFVVAAVTCALRFLPFVIFPADRKTPKVFEYLGMVLPGAIMGMLVVYCYRSTEIFSWPFALPELISAAVVVGLYLWKKNTLLSIGTGTVLYMILVQVVFVP